MSYHRLSSRRPPQRFHFEFIIQDESVGNENEHFEIGMKTERALFTALAHEGLRMLP
jgi:hypothetical protein